MWCDDGELSQSVAATGPRLMSYVRWNIDDALLFLMEKKVLLGDIEREEKWRFLIEFR